MRRFLVAICPFPEPSVRKRTAKNAGIAQLQNLNHRGHSVAEPQPKPNRTTETRSKAKQTQTQPQRAQRKSGGHEGRQRKEEPAHENLRREQRFRAITEMV